MMPRRSRIKQAPAPHLPREFALALLSARAYVLYMFRFV
jgi:hypothetical protein